MRRGERTVRDVLVGRALELERLDRLVGGDDVAAGRGRLLVVGDPGIGKTALLDTAARRATRRGVRVVRVRAAEAALDAPFALLEDVLVALGGPVSGVSGPARRAGALRGALARAGAARPLLLVVDDAHNADSGSLEVLSVALGRVVSDLIAAVVATRPDPAVERLLDDWPRTTLAPLSVEAAVAVLRSVLGPDADAAVLTDLATALQGVPLALREAPRLLTADQLAGREPLPDPLPVAPALMAAWRRVLLRLPDRTGAALVDLAVAGPRPDLLAALADGWGTDDLDPAAECGLIDLGSQPPAFRHPLVRDVVLRGAPAAVLRARHAEAARRARDLSLAPAVVVGHLVRSVVLSDGPVATEVAGQAERAEGLGQLDSACRAWEVAARLSTDPENRVAWALRGVRLVARFDLGVAAVGGLLDLLAGVDLDAESAGWVAWLRAVQRADVDPHAALDAQWAAIEEARHSSPAVLPVLLWEAAMTAWTLGLPDQGLRAARAAAASGEPASGAVPTSPSWTGTALLAAALIQSGRVAEGVVLRSRALAAADAADPCALELGALLDAVFLDDLLLDTSPGGARRLSVAQDRLRAAAEPMACLLGIAAWRARSVGAWQTARALLSHGRPLAESCGASGAARGMSALAVELAGACDERAVLDAEAAPLRALVDRFGDRRRRASLDRALGLRALLDGRLDDAAAALSSAADVPFLGRGLRDGVLPARVDLVETFVRRGDAASAAAWRERVREVLVQFDDPTGAALAHRTDALVAATADAADGSYRAALAAHQESRETFEQARTMLLLGEHLRRTRRRRDARAVLADAVVRFDRLGASPWLRRAVAEMRACGSVAPETGPPQALTPQERAVAAAVAAGRSNREAAEFLCLSPRTVEHHLGSCYRKLGVRGRAGLARAMLERVEGRQTAG